MLDTAQAQLIEEITRRVVYQAFGLEDPSLVVVGVSNRHVHLTEEDFRTLFGRVDLTHFKDVRQRGEYAAEETVTIHGPKRSMERVRVMGPWRPRSQVELSFTDARSLGVDAPVLNSGNLDEAAPIEIEGPAGRLRLDHGAIIAGRHAHMGPADAERAGVVDGQRVSIRFGGFRGGTLDNVLIRVRDSYVAEVHLDSDEANALGVRTGDKVQIVSSQPKER